MIQGVLNLLELDLKNLTHQKKNKYQAFGYLIHIYHEFFDYTQQDILV